MAFAAPVQRGDFFYNGDLYADAGNLNRHKRASVDEITNILRPDLKKPKPGASAPQNKDQPAHFFAAQCLHYGLPPSKDKARSKMRLLEAVNSSNLRVPLGISTMEEDMKKEFAKMERKARANLKASMATPSPTVAPPATSRKRKQADPAANTRDRNNGDGSMLGALGIGVPVSTGDAPGSRPPAKKAKTQESKPPSKKEKPNQAMPRQTARSSHLSKVWAHSIAQGLPPPGPPPVGYHITPNGRFASDVDGSEPAFLQGVKSGVNIESQGAQNIQSSPKAKVQPKVKKDAAVKKGAAPKKEPNVKKEPGVKMEPKGKDEPTKDSKLKTVGKAAVKKEPKPKKEPKIKQELASQPSPATELPSLGLINGIYSITCREIEGEWPGSVPGDGLTLTLTLDTPIVWGAYDFGMFSGNIRLAHRPTISSTKSIPFEWRGRENSEGEMSFGNDCNGSIRFLGDGKIDGKINLYGNAAFQGRRRPGPSAPVRAAWAMRDEWQLYNDDEYERERVGRWH